MQDSKQQKRLSLHLYLYDLTLVLISIFFSLFAAELALRLSGRIAGYVPRYSNRTFKCVKQLEIRQSFLTDDEGVFKADRDYRWPAEYQINSDGFRSIEFKQYETTRTKILFLGDSFTWGASAKPITNCFVDIVARRGYLTFNTGIPGTGLNQYVYIAEKYIPLLKPDIVAVMFYMGNDLKPPPPMLPHRNIYHITNAGWLYAFDENGNFMSPQDAYDYWFAKNNAAYRAAYVKGSRETLKTTMRKIFAKSVIGTYFWVWLSRVKWQLIHSLNPSLENPAPSNNDSHGPTKEKNNQFRKDFSDVHYRVKGSLARVKTISENSGARFMLFLIPAHPGLRNENNSIEHKLQIFEGFNSFIPNFLNSHDYMDLPNDHLNNSGHQKYAEFILRSLESGSH